MEKNVFVIDHPLVQHKLAFLRDKNCGSKEFRSLVSEIATLLCYEATKDLPSEEIMVQTPIGEAKCHIIGGRKLAFIPILRAGLGMVPGVLRLVPAAKVGHIGLYRDPKTLKPVKYYSKLPYDIRNRDVIILDPMVATGGSIDAAIKIIKHSHPKSIKLMCIIAAQQGIDLLSFTHPDVSIFCAAIDERLNKKGYIVPGLGDAGDRIFGTL